MNLNITMIIVIITIMVGMIIMTEKMGEAMMIDYHNNINMSNKLASTYN
jgi:hypothetical protein